jgi:XTP/dITP diphosphohydrolase
MIRRHPHVFGNATAHTPEDAYARWRAVKRREGRQRSAATRLQPLLVACWDLLREQPEAAQALKALISRRDRQRTTGGTSRRPSARPVRATNRSRRPGRGR